jgi:hypothetical protein
VARTCRPVERDLDRLFAWLFVGAGGVFWMSAVFGADYGYSGVSPLVSARNALLPLGLTLAVLVVGWFSDSAAAALLAASFFAVVAWGAVAGWEAGVWVLMGVTLLLPILIAAALYFRAARMERICALAPAGT